MYEEYKSEIFPKSDIQARWSKARALMAKFNLGALLITNEQNLVYFAGTEPPFCYSRPYLLIIPRDSDPILVVHRIAKEQQERISWVSDIRLHEELQTPVKLVSEIFHELHIDQDKIGTELGKDQRLFISYNDFESIRKSIPQSEFVDASDIILNMRAIKSEAEAQAHRVACKITTAAHESVGSLLKQGMTARELGSLLQRKLAEEGGYSPFVYVRNGKDMLPPMGASLFPTRNPNATLREGLLLVDMGVCWQGYWSDFSRHYWIGPVPKVAYEINQAEADAVNAGVEAVKPGNPIGDVYRASMNALKEHRIDMSGKMGRIGHGLGLSPCEKPDVLPTTEEIQRGMVFTLEPWIASEFGWFAIEQDMLVTPSGCEVLSLAPTDLINV